MEVFDAPSRYYPSDSLSLDELAYWVAFTRILGIGPARFKMLLDYFHEDVAAAWKASNKELAQAGLDQKVIDSFIKQRAGSNPQQELEKLERLRVIMWRLSYITPFKGNRIKWHSLNIRKKLVH